MVEKLCRYINTIEYTVHFKGVNIIIYKVSISKILKKFLKHLT